MNTSHAETYEFHDAEGPVPAHQHPNGGGWVADSAYVAKTSCVGPDAEVSGYARVLDDARIVRGGVVSGYTVVADKATVADSAVVRGHARVSGHALIRDGAIVEENATVCVHADVRGARVKGHAVVCGKARVSGMVENRAVVCETGVVDPYERYSGVEVVGVVFGQARECHNHHYD